MLLVIMDQQPTHTYTRHLMPATVQHWLTGRGTVRYSPTRTDSHKRANPWWVVVDIDPAIPTYYRWWVERSILNPPWAVAGIKLQPSMWGAHITVLDGRQEVEARFLDAWERHAGRVVTFEYSPEVYQKWKFWSLWVRCPLLDDIRAELGLDTPYPYHITVGRMP